MRASSEFAGRKGPEDVYGYLLKDDPWTPDLSGTAKTGEEVIWELAKACFGQVDGSQQENDTIPAAYTFFGQFVTHDITFDTRLDPRTAAEPRRNLRTPALDLDSVYGHGPVVQPYLYELDDPDKFAMPRTNFREFDLPRNNDASVVHPSSGLDFNLRRTALIGDPRNDENILIAQLHLAFLRFHNARVEELRGSGIPEDRVFEEARKLTTWHYQWVLVDDFLRKLCGDEIADKATKGEPLQLETRLGLSLPLLPFEFTLAALRFGHSMIGASYHLNDALQDKLRAPIQMFQDTGPDWEPRDQAAANSLEGQRALPSEWSVQWDRFLDVGDGATQWSQRINPQLAAALEHLPLQGISERERSLAYRTLWRGHEQGLPSGQSLARKLGLESADLPGSDPLWLYVLKEADLLGDKGARLGPLGAILVGEVLINLLRRDGNSFVNKQPDWEPTLPRNEHQRFGLAEFLKSAKAPIEAKDFQKEQ